MKAKVILALFLILSTNPLCADDVFLPQETLFKNNAVLQYVDRTPTAIDFVDINSDGLLDIVVSSTINKGLYFYINQGNLKFEQSNELFEYGPIYNFKMGDLDGDGDLDIWVIPWYDNDFYGGDHTDGFYHKDGLWLNDGNGYFTKHLDRVYNSRHAGRSFSLIDMNGDGALDVFKHGGTGVCLYLNNGGGIFNEEEKCNFVNTVNLSASKLGDYDQDGDMDLWSMNENINIYLNEGGEINLESPITYESNAFKKDDFILEDFNNDGLLDIQVLRKTNRSQWGYFLPRLINMGGGAFRLQEQDGRNYEYNQSAIAIDLNDDQYIDLWVANEDPKSQSQQVITLPNGEIDYETITSVNENQVKFVEKADLDNDGDFEIITFGYDGLHIWNKTNGEFIIVPQSEKKYLWIYGPGSIIDLNNDGKPDITAASTTGLKVALGKGRGVFGSWKKWFDEGFWRINFIDLNQDGYLDILFDNYVNGTDIKYALNNQNEGFSESTKLNGEYSGARSVRTILHDGMLYVFIFNGRKEINVYTFEDSFNHVKKLDGRYSQMEVLNLDNTDEPELVLYDFLGDDKYSITVFSFKNHILEEVAFDDQIYTGNHDFPRSSRMLWADFKGNGGQQLLVEYETNSNQQRNLRLLSLTDNGFKSEIFNHNFYTFGGTKENTFPQLALDLNNDDILDYKFHQRINGDDVSYIELSSTNGENKIIKLNSDSVQFIDLDNDGDYDLASPPGYKYILQGLGIITSLNTTIDQDFNGQWFSAEQNGHGLQVEEVVINGEPYINMAWYVNHLGDPVWLVGSAPLDGDTVNIDLAITEGPDFGVNYNPDDLNMTLWGSVQLQLVDNDFLQLDWNTDESGFGSGSMMMERLSGIKAVTPFASAINSCHSGSWFNPSENGHGFMSQVVNNNGEDVMVLTWYTYHEGEQIWLSAIGSITGYQAELQAITVDGAQFPPHFNPDEAEFSLWGDISFQLLTDDKAKISWESVVDGFESGEIIVERLTHIDRYRCH